MRSRLRLASLCAFSLLVFTAAPCFAQSFGIGMRLAMVKSETDDSGGSDSDSVRFIGGQIRLKTSQRMGLEVSLDRHTEENKSRDQRVREYPLQASLLLFPVKASFAPYILGGPGWYTTKVDSLSDDDETESTRKFGWHAGFGAELQLGKHAGIHADYRYTFLTWGDDDDDDESALTSAKSRNSLLGVGSVLPHHEGSMWTAGVTIYF